MFTVKYRLTHALGNVLVSGTYEQMRIALDALVAYGEEEGKFDIELEIGGFVDPQLSACYRLLENVYHEKHHKEAVTVAMKQRIAELKADRGSSAISKDELKQTHTTAVNSIIHSSHKCHCDIKDLATFGCKCGGI